MENSEFEVFKKQKIRKKNNLPKARRGRRQLAEVKNPILRDKINISLHSGFCTIRTNCISYKQQKNNRS